MTAKNQELYRTASGKLLDSIYESNRIYFEIRIKMGVVLLLQLIDL